MLSEHEFVSSVAKSLVSTTTLRITSVAVVRSRGALHVDCAWEAGKAWHSTSGKRVMKDCRRAALMQRYVSSVLMRHVDRRWSKNVQMGRVLYKQQRRGNY